MSACFSKEIGEAFVKAGVPHVVCVKVDSKIQDAAAIAFTRAFYVAFLSGKSVLDSFSIAKEALKASPYVPDSVLEGEKFILLPEITTTEDESAQYKLDQFQILHNKVIFSNRTVAEWPPTANHCTMGRNKTETNTFVSRNRFPSPPTDFEGRGTHHLYIILYY